MQSTSAESAASVWRGRRILVTGHTGFKGSWLCARLLRLGAVVCGIALPPVGPHSLWRALALERDVESQLVDLRDGDETERAVAAAHPEIVFHLAAQPLVRRGYREPVLTYATNVMGTVHVLDAIRRRTEARAVVVVTSDKVYLDRPMPGGYAENARLGGNDPYSGSKAATELVVETYRAAYFGEGRGPALASARAGNVIGGGDFSEDRLLPDYFRALERGAPLVLRRPDAIRPWQHVLDPLDGYLLLARRLLEAPSFAAAWNFGPSEPGISVRQVVEVFAGALGRSASDDVRIEPSPEHESAVLELDASASRARLGWQPRWATAAAVTRTAEWYRDYLHAVPAGELVARDIAAFDAAVSAGPAAG